MGPDWKNPTDDMAYLLDTIVGYFDPPEENKGTLQLQISSLDYSSYTGRIAVGKVHRGSIKMGDQVSIVQRNGLIHKSTVKELYTFEGLGKEKTKEPVSSGEIVAVLGLEDFDIGNGISDIKIIQPDNSTDIPAPRLLGLFFSQPLKNKQFLNPYFLILSFFSTKEVVFTFL